MAVLTSITLVRGRWYYSHGQLIAGPVSLIDLQQMIEQANRPRTSQFTPQKSELLMQRAPSVATGKALMQLHEDAPPVELDLQDIRTKAALLAFLRSP